MILRNLAALRAVPVVLGASLLLAGCSTLEAPRSLQAAGQPSANALQQVPPAVGPFVSTANPLASEAGMRVLANGGSAVDAAVAIQAVLGLVEPQSSGLGGGAFMMHFDAQSGEVTVYDGRETAPASATGELFFENGQRLSTRDAIASGRSTGVPGAVAMLGMAHDAHGRLSWSHLFADAERLATEGFVISPRLGNFMAQAEGQGRSAWANAYFTAPDGHRRTTGETLTNPDYARTVRDLAAGGVEVFYKGRIGAEIVSATRQDPRPGGLTQDDLAAYQPVEREALCRPFRIYVVCVPPPPSSGVALLQLLEMADQTPEIQQGPQSARAWAAFGQLQRLMYADRDRYVGDPAFVRVPVEGLLDEAYVASRAQMAPFLTGAAQPGTPPGSELTASDHTQEPAGTSHFVVVDRWGNAVSMTTTVESVFGSGRMAAGFFLNNQLTDFSFDPRRSDGGPAANGAAPGKRPRSSMSPVIVLDREGRLVGMFGSPGGSAILAYNAKALIGVLDWGLPVQQAFDLPNLVARGGEFGADTDRFSADMRQALASDGIVLRPNTSENSGLHGGLWRRGPDGWGWDGGADNRREGVALGGR